jgi:hypothetical protein
MGRHGGSDGAARPVRRLLLTALLTLGGGLGWWLLVMLAIDFGGAARRGSAMSWLLLVAASVGAVACLFVALWFGWRMLVLTGILHEYEPRRARDR